MDVFSVTYEANGKVENGIVKSDELDNILDECKKKHYKIINITHA